jgi:hypothetical protein
MIRTKLAAAAVAATALLALSACSSGVKIASPSTTASPSSNGGDTGNTTGSGGTSGGGTGSGTSADCQKLAAEWATAMAGASTGNDAQDAKTVFANLEKIVPDNLKDAAKTLADAYGKYFDLLAKYQGDPTKAMSDPKVLEAIQAMSTPEVQAASEKISTYFSSQCK